MRLLVAAVSFAFLAGCGSADETRAAQDEPQDTDVSVHPAINVCPHFEGAYILPQSIPLGSSALIGVRAVDPDASYLHLKFSWSATSGTFSDPDRPTTEYRCDALGDQSLTVVAVDASRCDAEYHIVVTCLSE